MALTEQIIKATEKRYQDRQAARHETLRRISEGSPLSADTPERVEKRLSRLARGHAASLASPVTAATAALSPFETLARRPLRSSALAADPIALERIIGRSDLIGVNYLELGIRVARSVGRVRIRSTSGVVVGYGTGFMVSPRLMLTNNHVLTDSSVASFSQIEFNYQDGPDGRLLLPALYDLQPDQFFITSVELDFTLVAVSERPHDGGNGNLSEFGWNRLIEAQGKVILGEYLNIIQHPNGEPKQVALRENQLIDLPDDFLQYRTDTAPGSSGSPVLNDQWEVVGLHHSGVPKRDEQRRILARDGSVWTPQMGDDQIDWIANEGIRASRIARFVKDQTLTDAQRRLRSQMFEAEAAAPTNGATSFITTPSNLTPLARTEDTRPAGNGNGTAVWTVPLEISVRLAPPSAVSSLTPNPSTLTTHVPTGYGQGPSARPSAGSESQEVKEALRELEEAASKPYYDEEQDASDRESYYAAIPDSLKPSELYRRLSTLLRETHQTELKYQPVKQLYPWVDLQPNLKLRSIYSGLEYEPEQIIREDFRIDRERATRVREMLSMEAGLSHERLREEVDLLEASLPYNCEHVVPQSWFGKREPMRGDLHHLFACESGCNSFRSNVPYFDFDDAQESVREACGRREGNKFEPTAGKGTVARAVLYFLLRYPGEINNVAQEYTEDRLQILLGWHLANPVTLHEKHRNMMIFRKQGNRNPAIDYPELVERIAFRLGLG